jgi:Tfp pilus assembly protein PilE
VTVLRPASRRRIAGESTATNLLLIFVLAGLITAFALPAYRDYTLREHAKLARMALQDSMVRYQDWEKFHPGRRPASLEEIGFDSVSAYVSADGTVNGNASVSSIYRISLSAPETPSAESCGLSAAPAALGFVLVAEPIQTQRIETRCGRLCLGSDGQKAHGGSASLQQCWGVP